MTSEKGCMSVFIDHYCLIEHQRLIAMYENSIINMPVYGSSQHRTFDEAPYSLQITAVMPVVHPMYILFDDRPFIQVLCHIVRSRAD